MGGGGHPPFGGQHGQKRLDLRPTHVARVAQAAPFDKHLDPLHIGLLGAKAIVLVTDSFTHLVQQARGTQRREGGGFHGQI